MKVQFVREYADAWVAYGEKNQETGKRVELGRVRKSEAEVAPWHVGDELDANGKAKPRAASASADVQMQVFNARQSALKNAATLHAGSKVVSSIAVLDTARDFEAWLLRRVSA